MNAAEWIVKLSALDGDPEILLVDSGCACCAQYGEQPAVLMRRLGDGAIVIVPEEMADEF